jgi:hypothetical protein
MQFSNVCIGGVDVNYSPRPLYYTHSIHFLHFSHFIHHNSHGHDHFEVAVGGRWSFAQATPMYGGMMV